MIVDRNHVRFVSCMPKRVCSVASQHGSRAQLLCAGPFLFEEVAHCLLARQQRGLLHNCAGMHQKCLCVCAVCPPTALSCYCQYMLTPLITTEFAPALWFWLNMHACACYGGYEARALCPTCCRIVYVEFGTVLPGWPPHCTQRVALM